MAVPESRTTASDGGGRAAVDALTVRLASERLDEAARAMSDTELCRAWRRSLSSLDDARSPVERLAVVLQRQSFLDAFEARDDVSRRLLEIWHLEPVQPDRPIRR